MMGTLTEGTCIITKQCQFYEWLRQNFLIALNREMCEVIAKKAAEIFSETK